MSKRIKQVNELIRQELGKIILREITIPEGCLATITMVETAANLKETKILISVFPPIRTKEIIKILHRNIGRIQFLLNKKLVMRPLPRISFKIDKTEENAEKIETLLNETEEDK